MGKSKKEVQQAAQMARDAAETANAESAASYMKSGPSKDHDEKYKTLSQARRIHTHANKEAEYKMSGYEKDVTPQTRSALAQGVAHYVKHMKDD